MVALGEAVRHTQHTLQEAGIPDARLEAELLLTNILKMPRHRIYAYQEQDLTLRQSDVLASLVGRRIKREPLAYILGHQEFYGLELAVRPGVMIPRPETELLVDRTFLTVNSSQFHWNAVSSADQDPNSRVDSDLMDLGEREIVIAEPGTGSGAICIVLAMHLPMARIYSTELYSEAIKVAEYNIQSHNVADRVSLLQGDLLDPVPEAADVIVANLPYVRSDEIPRLQPEIQWEPRQALDGGADGLDTIKRLLHQARQKLKPTGVMILEIDPSQVGPLERLARELFPSATTTVEQDLAHLDRIFVLDLGHAEH